VPRRAASSSRRQATPTLPAATEDRAPPGRRPSRRARAARMPPGIAPGQARRGRMRPRAHRRRPWRGGTSPRNGAASGCVSAVYRAVSTTTTTQTKGSSRRIVRGYPGLCGRRPCADRRRLNLTWRPRS
jgi:hypothetical protein